MKNIIIAAIAALMTIGVHAQNATNSPYSQYGYGIQADQSNGASVAMSGLSLGWREGNTVNFGNPASYSAIDSITFVFDAGVSGQITNFKENGKKLNANNSSLDYVVAAFRLLRRIGIAAGLMPYSNVGYSYYNTSTIGQPSGGSITTTTNTYNGSGGFHQVFIGLGIEPIRTKHTSVSVGTNVSYVWGSYNKEIVNSYSDTYVNTLSKIYQASVKTYKVDLALQLQQRLSKNDMLTFGATYSFGHNMSSDPQCMIISQNSQTNVADTATYKANAQLRMPTTFGVGFVWNHKKRFRVGMDWKTEKWGSIDYPMYGVVNGEPAYIMKSNMFKDRQRYILGAEFVPKEAGRKWTGKIRYRMGLTYASPYLRINGQDGPKEYGVSAGLGLPIMNSYNNRSILNISASWTRLEAANMIKENTFRINIGLTFNERWFAKWQVE